MGESVLDTGSYFPVGDITVLTICVVFIILLSLSYVTKSRLYSVFKFVIGLLMAAAFISIFYHYGTMNPGSMPVKLVYTLRILYHFTLLGNLYFYVIYLRIILHLHERKYKVLTGISLAVYIALIVLEILSIALGFGFNLNEIGAKNTGIDTFIIGYLYFVIIIMIMLIVHRNRIFKQIVYSIIMVAIVSFLVLLRQAAYGHSSFTTVSFLLPLFAVMYLVHSNPYDVDIGSLDVGSFNDYIDYYHKREKMLVLMSLYMKDFDIDSIKYPKEIREAIRRFAGEFYQGATLFQVAPGRMILVADIEKNANYEHIINIMLNRFQEIYPRYRHDYKIVIMKSRSVISENKDYVKLIKHIEASMEENTVHYFQPEDLESFKRKRFIIEQLEDIANKRNLNDERVIVYCQPVFNIKAGRYDTAEALMRIRLPEIGMIYPNEFIPLAEESGLIHSLSLVILNKTCMAVKDLLAEGYRIERISVNVSIMEMHEAGFCSSISKVIKDSGVPFDKIAIEITESQNEEDFIMVKEKIDVLKEQGMKFYLDDFGTGYSNLERIMELPFDIIKFDRSLVIACTTGSTSEMMVSYMARMFSEMKYSVLYEGVETEEDEEQCLKMSAKYLQGFKYSKPIPIENLKNYMDKTA